MFSGGSLTEALIVDFHQMFDVEKFSSKFFALSLLSLIVFRLEKKISNQMLKQPTLSAVPTDVLLVVLCLQALLPTSRTFSGARLAGANFFLLPF